MRSSAHVAAVASTTGIASTQRVKRSIQAKIWQPPPYLVMVPLGLNTILETKREVLDLDVQELCCVA